jgi:hypothetical protein
MSLMWGVYKDQVDELSKLMADNAAAWASLKADFDAQIDSLTAALDECVGQLAEATAAKKMQTSRNSLRRRRKGVSWMRSTRKP